MSKVLRAVPTALVGALLAAVLLIGYTTQYAGAAGGPANKTAAAGSTMEHFDDATMLLQEEMKVSSPTDLILQLTAECSIITELTTSNDTPTSEAMGKVDLWITIDGVPVPVAADDENSDGKVTFCNRTYGRTVTDGEGGDGIDEESDYIRTRTANAFNWFALNTGTDYDSDGDNILDIQVWGDFTTSEIGEAVADAWVGQRTLIIEPVHAANGETVQDVEPTPADTESNGKGKN